MAVAPALALFYPALLASIPPHSNYIIFPGEDGVPYVVDLEVPPMTLKEIQHKKADLKTVSFRLYTQDIPFSGELLKFDDINSIKNSKWNAKRPTRIITHGWKGDGLRASCTLARDAYLGVGDYNVIIIDWQQIASSILYGNVVDSIPIVAKHVANFVNFLQNEAGLDISTTKFIGHSLGGHLISIAARNVNGTVPEVIALDPAKPFFEKAGPGRRTDASDAKHVQIIHTNSGLLGYEHAVGTSDFYPNKGRIQPGCSIDLFGQCSHSRSYIYYAESIKNPKGFRATSMETSSSSYRNVVYMGGPNLDPTAKGSYILKTNNKPPFARC